MGGERREEGGRVAPLRAPGGGQVRGSRHWRLANGEDEFFIEKIFDRARLIYEGISNAYDGTASRPPWKVYYRTLVV